LALGLLAESQIPVIRGIFYTDVSVRVLIVSAVAAYGVLNLVFRTAAGHGIRGELIPVRICVGGRVAKLTALWDTGNSLRDPGTGHPVLVTAPGVLNQILPNSVRSQVTAKSLYAPEELLEPLLQASPALRPQLLPYHAVGVTGKLLLTLQTEWVEIGETRLDGVRVALSPTALGEGYTALWGGEVRKGGRYGNHNRIFKTAS